MFGEVPSLKPFCTSIISAFHVFIWTVLTQVISNSIEASLPLTPTPAVSAVHSEAGYVTFGACVDYNLQGGFPALGTRIVSLPPLMSTAVAHGVSVALGLVRVVGQVLTNDTFKLISWLVQ